MVRIVDRLPENDLPGCCKHLIYTYGIHTLTKGSFSTAALPAIAQFPFRRKNSFLTGVWPPSGRAQRNELRIQPDDRGTDCSSDVDCASRIRDKQCGSFHQC